ncbi:hypothetical protein [Campylobacter sp.]|uniref:hypothetical protein n=1 Tax=Campylobacter sp. TaxID=205 RepID=UPI002AA62077|nr:hypothetical protein [Campylobacter sp.]MCI7076740.1 hypothetical protein [Campylobacter sp.]
MRASSAAVTKNSSNPAASDANSAKARLQGAGLRKALRLKSAYPAGAKQKAEPA